MIEELSATPSLQVPPLSLSGSITLGKLGNLSLHQFFLYKICLKKKSDSEVQ
jgi:hypothetical protein